MHTPIDSCINYMSGSHLSTPQPMVMFMTIPICCTIHDWFNHRMFVRQSALIIESEAAMGPRSNFYIYWPPLIF